MGFPEWLCADKNGNLDFFTIVFSNTLNKAPWGKWPAADAINGGAVDAIKQIKTLPGKNMVLWGSVSLAQSLMKEKLIDEYHVQLCPVIIGGGRILFSDLLNYQQLHLAELRRYNTGTVFLNYHVS